MVFRLNQIRKDNGEGLDAPAIMIGVLLHPREEIMSVRAKSIMIMLESIVGMNIIR